MEELFGYYDTIPVNEYSTIEITDFKRLFKEAFPNPTYEKLIEIDGGKMGFMVFFDKLKQQGILD